MSIKDYPNRLKKSNADLEVWQTILPDPIYQVAKDLDSIVHAHIDAIVLGLLTIYPSLCAGTKVSQKKGEEGKPIIIFGLLIAKSGAGKSSSISLARSILLGWLDKKLNKEHLDVFLDSASAEGFEKSITDGSSPHLFLDEFGKLIQMSKKDIVKGGLLSSLLKIFDQGSLVTRKLRDTHRTQKIDAKGLGVFAATTLGQTNLRQKDMREMIRDGMLNRFLTVFGDFKRIPFESSLEEVQKKSIEDFAKKFYQYSRMKTFYPGKEALEIYQIFHERINQRYEEKFFLGDETAGFEVRMLWISLRVAVIFQLALDVETNHASNNEISSDALNRSIELLEYLNKKHFSQILRHANKSEGKSPMEKVKVQIEKNPGIEFRDLYRATSLTSGEAKKIVENLEKNNWAWTDEYKRIWLCDT